MLRHVGLVCRSVEKADRFYRDFLGLTKSGPKILPAAPARELFGIDSGIPVLNYIGEGLHFEIFILEGDVPAAAPPAHVCIETGDLDGFLERCAVHKIPVIRARKGESWVTFVRDEDGNLFEVKKAAGG